MSARRNNCGSIRGNDRSNCSSRSSSGGGGGGGSKHRERRKVLHRRGVLLVVVLLVKVTLPCLWHGVAWRGGVWRVMLSCLWRVQCAEWRELCGAGTPPRNYNRSHVAVARADTVH